MPALDQWYHIKMSTALYLHAVAPKEQPMLPRAHELVQAYDAQGLNKLLDDWLETDRILFLPRTMAMEICQKKIDPRRAKPMLAVFDRLLTMGVSVDDTVMRRSLLYFAAQCGNVSLVGLLLEKGADPNARSETRDETPLHAAAMMGHGAVCEVLLAHGASLQARNCYGNTPLASTCLHEYTLPAMRVLLAHGAAVDHRLADGRTLLHALAGNALSWKRKGGAEFADAVLALVSHGVDPEAVDNQGQGLDHHIRNIGTDLRAVVRQRVLEGRVIHQARLIDKATTPTIAPRPRSRL